MIAGGIKYIMDHLLPGVLRARPDLLDTLAPLSRAAATSSDVDLLAVVRLEPHRVLRGERDLLGNPAGEVVSQTMVCETVAEDHCERPNGPSTCISTRLKISVSELASFVEP
jgi:hypothetical protein